MTEERFVELKTLIAEITEPFRHPHGHQVGNEMTEAVQNLIVI